MKKFALKTTLITLAALFSFNMPANAKEPTLNKEYIQVRQAPSAQKEVIEFFSFYCPHCYDFEFVHHIPSQIQKRLPQEATLLQYHVDFLGRQSENLTRAWALAMALGAQEKVKNALFDGAQNDAFKSMDDIRAVFLANGISAEQFDGGIHSFAVNGLVNKQKQAAETFNVRGVPSFFINAQYQINMEGFADSRSNQEFIDRYVNTVLFLIKK